MKSDSTRHDDHEIWATSARSEPVSIETTEVRYLDMTGDGMPDAVERIARRAVRSRGSAVIDSVEETRRLEYGIGVDGRPAGVTERTRVFSGDGAERFGPVGPLRAAVA
jgi:hypothetical protein